MDDLPVPIELPVAYIVSQTVAANVPLHVAAEIGCVEAVRVLLEHGTNVGAEDEK
jgi:ankyrin repeat protein